MSIRPVSYSQIECDSCGKIRNDTDSDSTAARIAATKDGWRYVAWNVKGLQKRIPDPDRPGGFNVKTVPRAWDCCPECPLPESPVEANGIRDKRKVYFRGVWRNRDEV
jgi:hypothetical protein